MIPALEHFPKLIPSFGVARIGLDGFAKLLLGLIRLVLLDRVRAFFVGLARVLGGLAGSGAGGESLNPGDRIEHDDADIRAVQSAPAHQGSGIGAVSRKARAELAIPILRILIHVTQGIGPDTAALHGPAKWSRLGDIGEGAGAGVGKDAV